MVNKKEDKREEYVVRIGPLLKEVFERQKEMIKDATYNCVESGDWAAGEIIAKKVSPVL